MRTAAITVDLYVDVWFAINFFMDYLVLAVVNQVMHDEASRSRIALAASAGALWAVISVVCRQISVPVQILITYLGVSTVMVFLAFRPKRIADLMKRLVGLYLVTFLVSGAVNTIYQYTQAGAFLEQIIRGDRAGALTGAKLLCLWAGIWFGGRCLLGWILKFQKERWTLYEVTIAYRGKRKKITALLDTGNRLYEPVTKRPVHVVTYSALQEICESVSSVIYIPFSCVGKKSGMMPGIFLDEMEIHQGNEVKKITRPLVAVCTYPLSGDGQYEMLLHL